MKLPNKNPLWKALKQHAVELSLFPKKLAETKADFISSACNITIDYFNQRLTSSTFDLLFELAHSCSLPEKIVALMAGGRVNYSESKAALHTALRAPSEHPIWVDDKNIMVEVEAARNQMKHIVEQIRSQQWLGFSGKPLTNIVNIGIGGSDLGPRFCVKALADFAAPELSYHFVPDVDPTSFNRVVANLDPEHTLFIISSKSFTTQETLYNAKKAMAWIGSSAHQQRHFIAVTANREAAHQFGVETVLPIWSWIGGRYSFCSAINLITAIAIGYDNFSEILAGAHSMDLHFQQSEFKNNLPVLLALIGIWNNNFLDIHSLLLLTYAQQLEHFVPYVQQLDMESNGKSINNQGKRVNYATGPIVWGGLGNQAQHSYYQLLCQGTHKVTADLISLDSFQKEMINNMCASKIKVLGDGVHDEANPNGFIPGNIPLNHIRLSDGSPFTIGALVALYEHKVFVQSVIWDINPFDQPGVESAKLSQMEV